MRQFLERVQATEAERDEQNRQSRRFAARDLVLAARLTEITR